MVPRKFCFRLSSFGSALLIIIQIWEYFLAYSTIVSRQGSATCYQITLVKNINSTHRIEGIHNHFGLSGALANAKFDLKAWQEANATLFPSVPIQ